MTPTSISYQSLSECRLTSTRSLYFLPLGTPRRLRRGDADAACSAQPNFQLPWLPPCSCPIKDAQSHWNLPVPSLQRVLSLLSTHHSGNNFALKAFLPATRRISPQANMPEGGMADKSSVNHHVEDVKPPWESIDNVSITKDRHHAEGNALLFNKQGRVRKLPVPSDDPNDPLNFKWWEKYAVVFCCCWFCEYR